jgi:hypothetical protein
VGDGGGGGGEEEIVVAGGRQYDGMVVTVTVTSVAQFATAV